MQQTDNRMENLETKIMLLAILESQSQIEAAIIEELSECMKSGFGIKESGLLQMIHVSKKKEIQRQIDILKK